MERALASLQRVVEILPIAEADAIELVRINGWQCVTKKGEFQVGDLGVFLEIDSIPPETSVFQFLWQPKGTTDPVPRPAKFRIRTLKLRGALSQGLFLPLSSFELPKLPEGSNVTELLGVTKYEPPAPVGMGDYGGPFPAFIPKTDELRVQSVPEVLNELRGHPYVITMKYDGTSSTFAIDPRDGQFLACGRNLGIAEGDNLYWKVARKYRLAEILAEPPNIAIQGEIVGPGIQKNRLGLKELSWFAFSVFDISSGHFLSHKIARDFLQERELPCVEVIEEGASFEHTQATLLALAEGLYPGTKNEREGIVIRSLDDLYSPTLGGRLSFKAISNRYLLKEEE